jgi:glycosyltransferase involved in cell wall biosynthesis
MDQAGDDRMSFMKKIRRFAGLPDISQNSIRIFLDSVDSVEGVYPEVCKKTSLTIVVPCFGHAPYLQTMVKSILSQTRMPDEMIFVDDSSIDGSSDILKMLIGTADIEEHHRYQLLRNDRNLGQAASLNRAIECATSDLIMILNDDDYLMHDVVEVVIRLFERYREVVLIGGTSKHFIDDKDLAEANMTISSFTDVDDIKLDIRQPADVRSYRQYNDLNMTHSGCCFLKSVWEKVGGYYPDKRKRLVPFSDRDFQLRVNALFPVAVSSVVPFSFWRSGSSVDQGRDS